MSSQYQSSSLSFTQGFFVGQISVVVLAIFFIKFFIFGEPPASEYTSRRDNRSLRSFSPSHRRSTSFSSGFTSSSKKLSSVLRTSPPLTSTSILSKTYYNVHGHQPESLDWFNVLVAQTLAQVRNDAQQDGAILNSLTTILNGPQKPDFLDEIKVTEINLGEEFPIFSNCRIIPVESNEHSAGAEARPPSSGGESAANTMLQARMDVDLSDAITLGIETKLVLNYPKPLVAVMPVALAVSVVRFSGTLSISFIPSSATGPTNSTRTPTTLAFSFQPDYRLELSTHSLLGSRSRLQDVPKIAQLVEARIHAWFDERCVEPRFQQVALPSFWPRRSNTRGGEAEEPARGDEDAIVGDTPKTGVHTPRSRSRAAADRNVIGERMSNYEGSPQMSIGGSRPRGFGEIGELRSRKGHEASTTGVLSGFSSQYQMPGAMPM